ncbi:MAG: hypothetical protein D6805_08135 [Planctomycetota bacterium]|nr:MAG: hypothetical protein D6805_08135 [Planctomycetota bacterium]
MKTLKTLAVMLVVSVFALNVILACGGMSPQAAPAGFDPDVPTLPIADNNDTPTLDNVNTNDPNSYCPIHEVAKPCEMCNALLDNTKNQDDLEKLQQDLIKVYEQSNTSIEGTEFEEMIL